MTKSCDRGSFRRKVSIYLLLVFLPLGAFPARGGPVDTSAGETSLEMVLKKLADEGEVNIIISSKAVAGKTTAEAATVPPREALGKLAGVAQVPFSDSEGLFVVASPQGLDLMKSTPEPKVDDTSDPLSLDFRQTDIREIIRIIAAKSGVNIVTGKDVRGSVTIRVREKPWPFVLHRLATSMGYGFQVIGNTILVSDPRRLADLGEPPKPDDPKGETIDLSFRDTDIREIAKGIAAHFKRNFLAEKWVRSNVTIDLKDVSEAEAFNILGKSNGFHTEKIGNTWVITDGKKLPWLHETLAKCRGLPLKGTISMDFRDCDLRSLFGLLGVKEGCKVNIAKTVRGNVSLLFTDMPISEAVGFLAGGNGFSARFENATIEILDPNGSAPMEEPTPFPIQQSPLTNNPPPPPPPPPVVRTDGAPPPPPPPIRVFVSGIIGNAACRNALIMFNNRLYSVQKDQVIEGRFKVVDILQDRLVIYSNSEKMRRTFPLGGGR